MACDCCGVGDQFDDGVARNDLRRYRRRGPAAATKQLLAALDALHLAPSATLIDIGGGIGAIHHHLLEHGFARAAHVDASSAYLTAAAGEADRLGHSGRVTFYQGDFREVAPNLPPADAVTLDRVVCCDPDYESLLGAAANHARRALAFIYPRDRWYVRAAFAVVNAWQRVRRVAFRVYVHPPAAMAGVLAAQGLRLSAQGGTFLWVMELHVREPRA